MIISLELMIYCLIAAGGYLLAVSLVMELIEKKGRLMRGLPAEMVDDTGWAGFVINFMMELMFFVIIPTIAYSFFYILIPLSGVRAGMSMALVAFVLGAVPLVMVLSVRVKLPMPYLLFLLLSLIIKLGGSLSIIGYLYSL